MRAWLVVIVTSVVLSACGSDQPPPRDAKPDGPADGQNDPAYVIHGAQPWWLVGDAVTKTDDVMTIVVDAPSGTDFIDAWVGDLKVVRLAETADGKLGIQVSLTDLPAGSYDILLAANGSTTAFAKLPLYRSAPYYVLVTTDWDFSDPGDNATGYQDLMHRDHPELRITHFVGPYTFTDPAVTPERQTTLVTWLLEQRDTFHDELGLHIHPYCNFVTDAGLTCVTDQSTVYTTDDTGYTIKLGAYGRTNMGTLLDHAATLFEQHGLNRPKTFRAGGWTATLETVQALADKGYVADTSALNWARIEEWKGKELYTWTMANWNPINDTSQPYWPSQANVLEHTDPTMPLLEVPDNGVMIDYVSLNEMNGIFDANWNGQPLTAPITLTMGFHPATPGFTEAEYQRVIGFLKYADLHLGTRHLGPVVYVTLSDVVAAFAP
jgi:hypothetical protein